MRPVPGEDRGRSAALVRRGLRRSGGPRTQAQSIAFRAALLRHRPAGPWRTLEQVGPKLVPRYARDPGELRHAAFRNTGPGVDRGWRYAELLREVGDAKLLPKPNNGALGTCHHVSPCSAMATLLDQNWQECNLLANGGLERLNSNSPLAIQRICDAMPAIGAARRHRPALESCTCRCTMTEHWSFPNVGFVAPWNPRQVDRQHPAKPGSVREPLRRSDRRR
jgi:hypothetical protein